MPKLKSAAAEARILSKLAVSEPRLFARMADHHLLKRDVKRATKLLVKGLQEFPDSVAGWVVKGNLHISLKEAKLARAAYEKALTLESEIPFAHRQCAELAQEEGDAEGYLDHMRQLARLEPLDDNIQAMVQAAILRQAAVASGLIALRDVQRMMPSAIRQALLRGNALPNEITRRSERVEFFGESADRATAENTPPSSPPQAGGVVEKPVWKDPKVLAQLARDEEEQPERYVRVSWADAVTSKSAEPLVEIGPEQFDASVEAEANGVGSETRNTPTSSPPQAGGRGASSDVPPTPELKPQSPARAVSSSRPGLSPGRKPLIQPYVPSIAQATPPPSPSLLSRGGIKAGVVAPPPALDTDWSGATPVPPAATPPTPPSLEGRDSKGTSRAAHPDAPLRRPRLTADIKLPPMRPLDQAEGPETLPSPPLLSRGEIRGGVAEPVNLPTENTPPLSPPQARGIEQEPASLVAPDPTPPPNPPSIEWGEAAHEEAPPGARIPRDETPILRLLQAKRDDAPRAARQPLGAVLTHFEALATTPPSPPPQAAGVAVSAAHPIAYVIPQELPEEPFEAPPLPLPVSGLQQAITTPLPQPRLAQEGEPEPAPLIPEATAVPSEPPASTPPVAPISPATPYIPPEIAAREEAVRQKLAAIVEEVTGRAPAPSPEPPKPAAQPKETEGESKIKGKIATKTLAELYASQGDWARAAEVYEAMLGKFPTNEAYRKRLEALRAKLSEG